MSVFTESLPKATPYRGPGTSVDAGGGRAFSRARVMDVQGDLMIWCPEAKLKFTERRDGRDYDPRVNVFLQGTDGYVAHGLAQGWHWSTLLPNYPPELRQ